MSSNTIKAILDLGAGSGEVIDTLEANGYEFVGVEPVNGEFRATARKTLANGTQSFDAQALGRTRIDAARAVVKVVTRP